MADDETKTAPYGPPATVLMVIDHYRQREVPGKINDTTLTQLGVKESVLRLVKAALVHLNLIDEDDVPTDNFKALRYATNDDYNEVFGKIVMAAYPDIFAMYDPATVTRDQLFNAFRPYSPASQHDRMVTMFLALCQKAGMIVAQPPKRSGVRPPTPRTTPKSTPRRDAPPPLPPPITPPPSVLPPGKHDPLLTALVTKLLEAGEDFSDAELEAWVMALKASAPMIWPKTGGTT